MSFCPTKDLHSVYLDNELPEIYKAEYEAHVKSCPKCQKELEKLKALHVMFSQDSKSVTPDSHFMDQSYERLIVKMNYSKHSQAAKKSYPKFSNHKINVKYIGYAATGIAAAAICAFAIPFGLSVSRKVNPKTTAMVSAIANAAFGTNQNSAINNVSLNSLNSGRSVVISGNIEPRVTAVSNESETSISSFAPISASALSSKSMQSSIGRNVSVNAGNNFDSYNFDSYFDSYIDSYIENYIENPINGRIDNRMDSLIEVFRPDISQTQTISIRVTVPGMNAVPVTTELEVPVSVLLGR